MKNKILFSAMLCLACTFSVNINAQYFKKIITMKKILFIGLLLLIALTISAQRQMQVWQDGVPTSFAVAEIDSVTFIKETPMIGDPGFESLTILKFKKPEYKDYILTNRFDEYFCIHQSSEYLPDGCWENMQGKCPFHELKQGYVLVDWRWTSWFTPTILFESYKTQETWNQAWPLDTPHDSSPIVEEYWITIEDFDLYTGDIKYNSLYYLPYITHYFSVNYIPTHKDPNIEYPPTNLDYAGDMSWEELEAFYDSYYQNIIQRLDSIMEIKSLVEIYEEIY